MREARKRSKKGRCMYHVFNRVVDARRWHPFCRPEKEKFWDTVLELSGFFNVEILSLAIMSNHFHMTIRDNPELPGHREMIERWRARYAGRKPEPDWEDEEVCRAMAVRMADFSMFMKELQEEMAEWFNRRNDRVGHLWAGRFKSTILGRHLAFMRSLVYNETNAPRAGICERPEEYPFCTLARLTGEDRQHPFATAAFYDLLRADVEGEFGKAAETWSRDRLLAHLREACRRRILEERQNRSRTADPGGPVLLTGDDEELALVNGGILGTEEFVRETLPEVFGPERAAARRLTAAVTPDGDRLALCHRIRRSV
jgi:REP element-mobilizing transposase RayT